MERIEALGLWTTEAYEKLGKAQAALEKAQADLDEARRQGPK